MILHLSQIFFTLARTFIFYSYYLPADRQAGATGRSLTPTQERIIPRREGVSRRLSGWIRPLSFAGRATRNLLVAVNDTTLGQVVRRHLHSNAVAGKDSDVVHPHFAADVGEQLDVVAFVQLDAEPGAGQILQDYALDLDALFLVLLLLVLRSTSYHT